MPQMTGTQDLKPPSPPQKRTGRVGSPGPTGDAGQRGHSDHPEPSLHGNRRPPGAPAGVLGAKLHLPRPLPTRRAPRARGRSQPLGAAVSSAGYFGYKFLFLVLAMELHFGGFSTFQ